MSLKNDILELLRSCPEPRTIAWFAHRLNADDRKVRDLVQAMICSGKLEYAQGLKVRLAK